MKKFLISLFVLLLAYGHGIAQVVPEPVRMEVSSFDHRMAPEHILQLKFTMDEGWHIYWHNPGDTGIPTSFKVEGARLLKTGFPPPQRFNVAGMNEFGYTGGVKIALLIDNPTAEMIGVAASVVACNNICLPLELRLSVPMSLAVSDDIGEHNFRFGYSKNALDVNVAGDVLEMRTSGGYEDFFPYDDAVVTYDKPQKIDGGLALKLVNNWQGKRLRGMLVRADGNDELAVEIDELVPPPEEAPQPLGMVMAIMLAFLGGIILNLMPCVFPVLSLKALQILRSTNRGFNVKSAACYTAGIMLSFLLGAILLLSLKQAGEGVGWGFQLQNSDFVMFLSILFFMLALNLSGFFNINLFVKSHSQHNRLWGSFLTGLLAVLVATPCSAPFMGVAIGATLLFDGALATIVIFLALGLGMALPYIVVSVIPFRLPRSGRWMQTLQQFLSFPLHATAIWLLWVLMTQHAYQKAITALSIMLFLMFFIWLLKNRFKRTAWLVLPVFAVLAWFVYQDNNRVRWHEDSPQRLDERIAHGEKVFVKFTASWCLTCIVNEKAALSSDEVAGLFARYDIVPVSIDWTDRDDGVARLLERYGRISIPLYVYYDGSGAYKILPQVLTPGAVRDAIAPTE